MNRSTARRHHQRIARLASLKERSPATFARKGERVFNEAASEAAYRLRLLVDGEGAKQAPARLGWRSFDDLLSRVEVYGLRTQLECRIGELTTGILCSPMSGRPVGR